jgi:hypothetical protein
MSKQKPKHSKKSSKRANKFVDKKTLLLSAAIVVGSIAVFILSVLPIFQPLRESLVYSIIIRLAGTALVVYFAWISKEKPPKTLDRILCSVLGFILLWLPIIVISEKALIIIIIAAVIASAFYLVYNYIFRWELCRQLAYETLCLAIIPILEQGRFAFLNSPNYFHFWQISLIIGAFAAGATIVLQILKILEYKSVRETFFAPLVVFVFVFVFTTAASCNLNYALDTSPPSEHIAIIEEKDMRGGGRQTVTYSFILNLDGEKVKIDVSQSEYYSYESGDHFKLKLYKGAFNDPFYTK